MNETAHSFGRHVPLCGILTHPVDPRPDRPAVVFLNAGVTHRVGPSRLSVRMARELAADGFTSLRFDFSSIGDSGVRADDLPPQASVFSELEDAFELVRKETGINRFCLIGICSGAAISYLMAKRDERVVAAMLINGQGHLHGLDADLGAFLRNRTLTRHFWRIAFRSSFRRKNWRKALAGQLDPKRILGTMIALPFRMMMRKKEVQPTVAMPDAAADLRAVAARGVHLFHLYSEGDDGLDYFLTVLPDEVRDVVHGERSRFEVIPGANHVFTLLWSQDRLVTAMRDWIGSLPSPPPSAPPSTGNP